MQLCSWQTYMTRKWLIFITMLCVNQCVIAGEAKTTEKSSQSPLDLTGVRVESAGANKKFTESYLEIFLNDINLNETALVISTFDGRLWARTQDLKKWRLRFVDDAQVTHSNELYSSLDSVNTLIYKVDAVSQSLRLNIPAENLQASLITLQQTVSEMPTRSSMGGFFNYDVNAIRTQGKNNAAAQLELGVFAAEGVATSQFLIRNFGDGNRTIRLDSTLTMDQPQNLTTLRLGDAISRGGSWGKSLRFGGIQWSTNFATQPEFITIPLPTLSGTAALPSVAEVFVNNIKISQSNILPGPFSLQDIPVVNGQGDVRMVVKDLLGREQTISQPFYATRTLLKKGLSDFSYELGAERENFGQTNNNYGSRFFSGTHRRGLTDQLTGEIRSELSSAHQAVGVSSTKLIPGLGLADLALVGSLSNAGSGKMIKVEFEKQMLNWNFGTQMQFSSKHFKQLGVSTNALAPRLQAIVHAGLSDAQFGSLGVAYVRKDKRSEEGSEVLSTTYNRNLGKSWLLGLFATKNLTATRDKSVGFTLTHVFDDLSSANFNTSRQKDAHITQVHMQKNIPNGEGIGYYLLSDWEANNLEANLKTQSKYGVYSLQLAKRNNDIYAGVSASGGVAMLGGQAFLTRRVNDSFAVVRVADYPDVQVYLENQAVGRTNSAGATLISGLRPYQKNRISIEQADLPLDTQIEALEVKAAPYFRSGYEAVFPVKKSNGALLNIVLESSNLSIGGTLASLNGSDAVFPVATDGRAYFTNLKSTNLIKVLLTNSRSCTFEVSFTPSTDPLPNLGSFICKEFTQ